MNKGIESCANQIIRVLAKEVQDVYNFAFDQLNLPTDHEMRKLVERPVDQVVEVATKVDNDKNNANTTLIADEEKNIGGENPPMLATKNHVDTPFVEPNVD